MYYKILGAFCALSVTTIITCANTQAATASINGALIPTQSSIIDASGATWTIVSAVVKKNGATAGNNSNAAKLLYLEGVIYQENTANNWYKWEGTDWSGKVADPRVVSASGAKITSTGHLVDSALNVWALSGEILYKNGARAASNYNTTTAEYYSGNVYCENTSSEWYEWVSTNWTQQTGAPGSGTATSGVPAGGKYIRSLALPGGLKVVCDGKTDDSAAVQAAFTLASATGKTFPLIVDCVANLDIGLDQNKTIFVDNNLTVYFTSAGKFIVNNQFTPAFMLAGTSNVLFTNMNIEYNATFPVAKWETGYDGNAEQFSDVVLSNWLIAHRGMVFDHSIANGLANYTGNINSTATFYFMGQTTNVTFNTLTMTVPAGATTLQLNPYGFQFLPNWKNNYHVTAASPKVTSDNASEAFAVPSGIHFTNVTIDGMVMGFQGNVQNSTWTNVTALRYGDILGSSNQDIGFPPPHLFYLNYAYTNSTASLGGDPKLANYGIVITNVEDALAANSRVGTNFRTGAGGNALSLKIGCKTPAGAARCSVNGYKTNRPDGFMDILTTDGLNLSNVTATYNSSKTYYNWPGIRWPGGGGTVGFQNMTFTNVNVTDLSAETGLTSPAWGHPIGPMSNFNDSTNANLVFNGVTMTVQKWAPGGNIVPTGHGVTSGEIEFIDKSRPSDPQYLKP